MIGLLLIAIGTGGIKPCVSAFGGDQFESGQVCVQIQFVDYRDPLQSLNSIGALKRFSPKPHTHKPTLPHEFYSLRQF